MPLTSVWIKRWSDLCGRILALSHVAKGQQFHGGKALSPAVNHTNAAADKNQHDFINYIQDMRDYTAPGSKTPVTLPSSYDNVYSNGSDQYVLSNDASFEPAPGWSKMERAR